MRIAIDAMGGDHAPDEIIAGALEVLPQLDKDDTVLLVGPQETLEPKLAGLAYDKERLTIVDAPDVIGMDEKPVDSLRKKPRSSISVLAKLAKLEKAD
ncbi:MAG: phosphate--acyl-ACP acyltransferase, partial [Planctomycetaceae bacterium]